MIFSNLNQVELIQTNDPITLNKVELKCIEDKPDKSKPNNAWPYWHLSNC